MYYLTCDKNPGNRALDYYSMNINRLEEIKTMEYCEYDFNVNGFYTFEIGKFTKGRKYYKIGEATVLLTNCKCVRAEIRLSL